MGAGQRLKEACDLAGFDTVADFARAAGIEPGTSRQHVNRDSIPKDAADKYARKLTQRGIAVSAEWLLYGRGKAPVKVNGPPVRSTPQPTPSRRRDREASVDIPELDVRAGMGGGGLNDGEQEIGAWSLPAEMLRAQTTAPLGALRIIRAIGDSNLPEIVPGTRIIVDTADRQPSPPGFFAVWDGLGLVIKRVEYIPHSDPPRVRLTSVNPAYQPYERDLDEAQIQGRIIGRWAWM